MFDLSPDRISIRPDFSRRTPVVDPDDHHIWVSLGCATENMLIAAAASLFAAGLIALRATNTRGEYVPSADLTVEPVLA
jgi:hypothetical protein